MIIQHSLLILEQLTKIEALIHEIERLIDNESLPIQREKIILGILKSRELERSRKNSKGQLK